MVPDRTQPRRSWRPQAAAGAKKTLRQGMPLFDHLVVRQGDSLVLSAAGTIDNATTLGVTVGCGARCAVRAAS